MAKRKEEQWVFNASAKTVKIPGHVEIHDLLLINNATRGVVIANQFESGKKFTKTHSHPPLGTDPDFPYSPDSLPLTVTDITSDGAAGFSNITITVTSGEAIPIDTPVSVSGTSNELAEGLFIVTTSNNTTSFSYKAKGFIAAGSIFTTYNSVKKGGIFGSTSLAVAGVSTVATGTTTFVTVDFQDNHGFVPGSPIAVLDSTAGLQAHEGSFFVNRVPFGTRIVYDAGANVGVIQAGNLTVYGKNDANFVHRPFDGGVKISNFYPIHGLEAKRQTKRYFRYQSGKGFFYSTGALLAPNYDIETLTYSNPYISIETAEDHGLQVGATIKISGVVSANYNGTYVVEELLPTEFLECLLLVLQQLVRHYRVIVLKLV